MPLKWIDLRQPYYEEMPIPQKKSRVRKPLIESHIKNVTKAKDEIAVQITTTRYHFSSHLGTHIDAPKHVFAGGKSIDQYPFERFAGTGVVLQINREGKQPITVEDLRQAKPEIRAGDIVFLYTGWALKYGTEEYYAHPYLNIETAQWLVDKKVSMVGIDCITVDLPFGMREEGFDFPIHRLLLENDILIVENLGPNLVEVMGKRLILAAFPLNIKGIEASPSPVFGLLQE